MKAYILTRECRKLKSRRSFEIVGVYKSKQRAKEELIKRVHDDEMGLLKYETLHSSETAVISKRRKRYVTYLIEEHEAEWDN